jgi:hypothetical protein
MWGAVLLLAQFSQSSTGELHLEVTDASGTPLESVVEVVSDANQFHASLTTNEHGVLIARRLPFGVYRVVVTLPGFATAEAVVEIRSAIPTEEHVVLNLAGPPAQVTVTPDETLQSSRDTARVDRLGRAALSERVSALPGRSMLEAVNTQPGWLIEANGVLHPRGSEYQTQYVVDGLPFTDNRSPAFAQGIEADEADSINVLTGGYPAEYGRKLGGVVEVVTGGSAQQGLHGRVVVSGGSFDTKGGDAALEYVRDKMSLAVAAGAGETDRYLDPPVEENLTNHGSLAHAAVRLETDLSSQDRFGFILRGGETHFLVPNELVQEAAGQRQDRDSSEIAGQFSYQRVVSSNVLGDVRAMVRDLSAALWSNSAATPILAAQDRGFREVYVRATVSVHHGDHELKAGGDVDLTRIREQFSYLITDPGQFDEGTPLTFAFQGRATGRDASLFLQDQVRVGGWTINAGLRWDRYQLVVNAMGVSPRLGVAWSWPSADLVVRASYDRAFQTPAIENILLSSSPSVAMLNPIVVRLPVPPSRGNFYEAGFSKGLWRHLRLDATYFSRREDAFADDDLLLNTGVSFPIAYRHATIDGTEVKLDVREWGRWSGFVSYTNLLGVGELPITGGLLLGAEAADALPSSARFAISQDQRNTVSGRVSYRIAPPVWVALGGAYGSGLPVEFDGSQADALATYGPRIVDRVNFEIGRVRPSFSLDASLGMLLVKKGARDVRLQIDARNLTDQLNVINFAGLFSGTAVAAPRSVAARVLTSF